MSSNVIKRKIDACNSSICTIEPRCIDIILQHYSYYPSITILVYKILIYYSLCIYEILSIRNASTYKFKHNALAQQKRY